ncbi:LOW QUALITY PROTEIN: cip1-interacting zinc finger protein [Ctenodactylus gundi]
MFSQQQQLQLQQLQQLQQLLQQPSPPAALPVPVGRALPQPQPQQQLLGLQGAPSASLLSGPVLQRALLLQQLQGLDQFAMAPATYDSTSLTLPTATMGNFRTYNMATPSLTAPSLTPPQLAPPNLQQFFPQATRQSLLGPPPVGVPMNPSGLSLSGRTPQKQTRIPSTNPNRKDSSSQTMPEEDEADPQEGSEEALEPPVDPCEDPDSPLCTDGIVKEKRRPTYEPELYEAAEPLAKRSKSSELPTEKGPPGQPQAKVPPQTRMTAPKQTQTPELLPEPQEARVLPRFQPRVLQVQAKVQPQTQPRVPGADTQGQPKLQKQAQTQTSPEHLVPLWKEMEPVQPPSRSQPPTPGQPQLQTCLQGDAAAQMPGQPRGQPLEQPAGQGPAQPAEQTQSQPESELQGSVPAPENTPVAVPLPATGLGTPPNVTVEAGGDLEDASLDSAGTQVSVEASQEPPVGGPHAGDCEKGPREMPGMRGAGGSLKVTILQSSDSRAFSTTPLTPVSRPCDAATATPAAASAPAKQSLHFFCSICKAGCSSQQEFQAHMSEAQHQQRLAEMQHLSQTCLLSLLPMSRDVLERDKGEPPPRRWCNTCQVYYMGDLIQHRRTQDHKVAKQSLRPFCTVCNRYFKTPRKFVEHVKSQGHKDKVKEVKTLEKELAGQDEDHFITVDAVGCFEGDEEDLEEEEEEEIEVEEEFCKQVRPKEGEEWKGSETYNPDTEYGMDLLVPVTGSVCCACRKFYHGSPVAQQSHCRSLAHFENVQKYKAANKPSPTPRPVSRQCAINARNALTALFTSNISPGRLPAQSSPQDKAKIPSKVTARAPSTPLRPRRSSRLKRGSTLWIRSSNPRINHQQKHKVTENPSPTSRPVNRCAINARNALTALFTSSVSTGHPPAQPSPQDMAKPPSKATAQTPKLPSSFRRSSRLKS